MSAPEPSDYVTFHSIGKPGVRLYEVTFEGVVIGRVQRAQLGAGQFGSSWQARTASGQPASNFPSRGAAALWLVERARA